MLQYSLTSYHTSEFTLQDPDELNCIENKINFECDSRLHSRFDSNNNSSNDTSPLSCSSKKSGDKYSLRPRSMRRKKTFLDEEGQDQNFNDLDRQNSKINQNKSLRGRSTIQTRPKQKSAPLSKYRRKTANARERTRMREINGAFEALRRAVPQITPNQQQNEKLTKITTLRLAMKYISALTAALSSCPSTELPQQDLFSECSELESFLLESDGESLPLRSDQSDRSLSEEHSMTSPCAEFSLDFDDSLTPDLVSLASDFADQLPFDPFLGDFS